VSLNRTSSGFFFAAGGLGCSVMLADRDGVILERRGAPCDDAAFEDCGLWTGAVWSEKFKGTNGIGTCLVERRTVTIDRDQHFYARNSVLSCTSAPIFDEDGELAAAIDVSSSQYPPGFAELGLAPGFSHLVAVVRLEATEAQKAKTLRRWWRRVVRRG
jgi:transcriptional regulator of acetoin/glycerol metabolism